MLAGRQSLWLLYQHLATDQELTVLYDVDDITDVTCSGENDLARFWTQLQTCIQCQADDSEVTPAFLRSHVYKQIRNLPCFTIEMVEWKKMNRSDPRKSYKTLSDMITRHLEFLKQELNRKSQTEALKGKAPINATPAQVNQGGNGETSDFV